MLKINLQCIFAVPGTNLVETFIFVPTLAKIFGGKKSSDGTACIVLQRKISKQLVGCRVARADRGLHPAQIALPNAFRQQVLQHAPAQALSTLF